jgi:hypothetical protein
MRNYRLRNTLVAILAFLGLVYLLRRHSPTSPAPPPSTPNIKTTEISNNSIQSKNILPKPYVRSSKKSIIAIISLVLVFILTYLVLWTQRPADRILISSQTTDEFWVGVGVLSDRKSDSNSLPNESIRIEELRLEVSADNNSISNILSDLLPKKLNAPQTLITFSLDWQGLPETDQTMAIVIPWDLCPDDIGNINSETNSCSSKKHEQYSYIATSCYGYSTIFYLSDVDKDFQSELPSIPDNSPFPPESREIRFSKVRVPILDFTNGETTPSGIKMQVGEVGFEEKWAILIPTSLLNCPDHKGSITIGDVFVQRGPVFRPNFTDAFVKLEYRSVWSIPIFSIAFGKYYNDFSLRTIDNSPIGEFTALEPKNVFLTLISDSILPSSLSEPNKTVQVSQDQGAIALKFEPNSTLTYEFRDTKRSDLSGKLLFFIGIAIATVIQIFVVYVWEKI